LALTVPTAWQPPDGTVEAGTVVTGLVVTGTVVTGTVVTGTVVTGLVVTGIVVTGLPAAEQLTVGGAGGTPTAELALNQLTFTLPPGAMPRWPPSVGRTVAVVPAGVRFEPVYWNVCPAGNVTLINQSFSTAPEVFVTETIALYPP
jgi:hypothetical protein